MPMYATSLMPLINIRRIGSGEMEAKEIWYADDGGAGGSLKDVRKWWDSLCKEGPLFGYHPKPEKNMAHSETRPDRGK